MLYISGVRNKDKIPRMITPRIGGRPAEGEIWAADNGRYSDRINYKGDEFYLGWLSRMPVETCLFATAPDTFSDAITTLRESIPLLPRIRALGYKAALVAQPTMTIEMTPWDDFDVLFIGGPDEWQFSERLTLLVKEAIRRGKKVHMGRVNSLRRMRYAASLGCESVDGTILKYNPSTDILGWLATVNEELTTHPHL